MRVARSVAKRFGASIIGVFAFAVESPFVAEDVIIEEAAPADLERMRSALVDKNRGFGASPAFRPRKSSGAGKSSIRPCFWRRRRGPQTW